MCEIYSADTACEISTNPTKKATKMLKQVGPVHFSPIGSPSINCSIITKIPKTSEAKVINNPITPNTNSGVVLSEIKLSIAKPNNFLKL